MSGGKSGAEYVQGLFRSMVLRPVVQAIVNPVAQAVTGTVNAAIQGATGVNFLGVAGNAASLAGIGTTAAVGFGNVASSMGFLVAMRSMACWQPTALSAPQLQALRWAPSAPRCPG